MKKSLLFLFFFICTVIHANAQFQIQNEKVIPRIKGGITYIAIDPTDSATKMLMKVYKQYWTVSKVKFINLADIESKKRRIFGSTRPANLLAKPVNFQFIQKFLTPNSSFFTVGEQTSTLESKNVKTGKAQFQGMDIHHYFMELWTVNEKYFKKAKKKLSESDKVSIARIEWFQDHHGNIINWGPGMVKNYVQLLMTLLDAGKERSLASEEPTAGGLRRLLYDKLYVPEYVLTRMNPMTGADAKKHDPEKLFKHFDLDYEILPTAELNRRILTDSDGFPYLVYVRSSTFKFISVFNSATGELLYEKNRPMSYNIKSADFKALKKEIRKS